MKTRTFSSSPRLIVGLVVLAGAALLAGCSAEEGEPKGAGGSASEVGGSDSSDPVAGADAGGAGNVAKLGKLIVVTERESPEVSLQYLHVLDAWPESGELGDEQGVELGQFVNVHALGRSVFVHQPEDATVRRLLVGDDGAIAGDDTISFAAYGVTGFAGDLVYASASRAFLLDEAAGQLVIWNPEAMEVVDSVTVPEGALTREGLAAQVSRGITVDGHAFVSSSWRDWETLAYYDSAAIGTFEVDADEPQLRIIEDDRCASTVTPPYLGPDGFVYLVSDAALGFDALANPKRSDKTLCVLRLEPGARGFDPDFFVDLGELLGSPGFYAAHPMKDGKLLVNVWASDVDVDTVADPSDPGWYWSYPPYFEYAIVDLANGTSSPVKDIPRAPVQWSITLRENDDTYVQTYREDRGSDLHRVDPDGTVTRVLSNPSSTDVQYIARLELK